MAAVMVAAVAVALAGRPVLAAAAAVLVVMLVAVPLVALATAVLAGVHWMTPPLWSGR
jgi:hypothetical protein